MIKFGQSMRKKASREVNLTPMIDIIFNLLIFFLITAVISQKGLNIKLPNAETAEKRPQKTLEITVTADNLITFNGNVVKKEGVFEMLKAEKERPDTEKHDVITLKADEKAHFGLFIFVMDTARKLGFENLAIAAERKLENEVEEH